MRSSRLSLAVTTLLFLSGGCSNSPSSPDQVPRPTGVDPNVGYATAAVPVLITGSGFLAKAQQPAGGGSPVLDTTHRAWLGNVELTDVVWIDTTTLKATVPPGLPLGAQDLTVENALGERGTLKGAYTVLSAPGFSGTLAVDRTTVNVGQPLHLTLVLTNNGSAAVTNLSLGTPTMSSSDGGAARPDGPAPTPPASIAPGEQQSVTWTYRPTSAGHMSFSVTATGQDALTGQTLNMALAAPAVVLVQTPAALSATLEVSPSVALGTDFTVSLNVANTGGATARAVTPAAPPATLTSGGATATLKASPAPASVDVAGGTSAVFTWTYTAGNVRGTLEVTGSATGTDDNSGASLTAAPAAKQTVLAQAAIVATVKKAPTTYTAGAPFTVTINVANPGTANVTSFALNAPIVPAGVTISANPAAPATLAVGQNLDFTWTVTAANAGATTITFRPTGIDSSVGQPIAGEAPVQVAITVAPAVTATASVSAPTADLAQSVTVTLTLANAAGSTTANVTAVAPSIAPAASGSCNSATPAASAAAPVAIAGGTRAIFTWTCSASAVGAYTLGAAVTAVDANTGTAAAITGLQALGVTFTTQLAVTVTNAGNGTGSVTSTPAGINACGTVGGTCSASFTNGTTVTLTATPGPGSSVTWTGCDTAAGGVCTLTSIAAARPVTATFTLAISTVTATAGQNGSITPSGPVSVNYGSSQTFTITPATNYHVADVLVDGTSVLGSVVFSQGVGTYTFTNVTANHAIAASFAIDTFTVTPSAGANGTISPSTAQTVAYNGTTSFTVTPSPGYNAAVTGCGGSLNGSTYTTGPITSSCSVTATFTLQTLTVTPSAGPNGTISPATPQTVGFGAGTSFTVTPDTGYLATMGGTCGGTLVGDTYTTGPITSSCSVTATFTLQTFTVTPSAGTHGTISPATPQTVGFGAGTSFTVTPDTGYLATMGGTCGGTLVGDTYTTAAITANCTVTASFAANQYPVSVTNTGAGTGTVACNGGSCAGTFDYGSTVELTAVADPGSSFVGFTGACSGGSPCTFTVGTTNAITAEFTAP